MLGGWGGEVSPVLVFISPTVVLVNLTSTPYLELVLQEVSYILYPTNLRGTPKVPKRQFIVAKVCKLINFTLYCFISLALHSLGDSVRPTSVLESPASTSLICLVISRMIHHHQLHLSLDRSMQYLCQRKQNHTTAVTLEGAL